MLNQLYKNENEHLKFKHIHLQVSPRCNIQCKFCSPGFNKRARKSEVTSPLLLPQKALELVRRSQQTNPNIRVIGVAGPGDTLATPHALDALELIHHEYPQLIKCLSTNGLMLKENAERITKVGVKTITVAVNAVNADILQDICSHIIYNGHRMTGKEAALWLLLAQLAGIKKISQLGVIVKINTVLIPGVNDQHIDEIARVTAGVGASFINIIPVVPHDPMQNYRKPNSNELDAARKAAQKYLPLLNHCHQCGADAYDIVTKKINITEQAYAIALGS